MRTELGRIAGGQREQHAAAPQQDQAIVRTGCERRENRRDPIGIGGRIGVDGSGHQQRRRNHRPQQQAQSEHGFIIPQMLLLEQPHCGGDLARRGQLVGKRYVAEAAIPLAALGLKPAADVTVSGDFGATFGDADGKDTVLRSYWNNQATGLVADEVWELVPEPKNWGKIGFE